MANALLFRWQAMDKSGALVQGAFFCQSQQDVMEKLLEEGLMPLTLSSGKRYRASQWHWQQKIALFSQLATLLKAGLTLSASLQLLGEKHENPGWQALLSQLQKSLAEGTPFSTTLTLWPEVFPPLYPALMSVGEMTGRIETCCEQLARQQERQLQLQKKVTQALRYPLFVLLLALVVSVGMLVFVLPEFISVYQAFDAPLPVLTAGVITLATWLQHQGMLLSVAVGILGGGWRWQTQRSADWQKREQRWLLSLPLLGKLYRGGMLCRVFMTLALTQQAGLTLLQGLQAVEKTLTPVLWREVIQQLQQHIASGYPLHQALKQHSLFSPLCCQLIKVGEESGSLDNMLARLGNLHEEMASELADNLAAAIEPLLMVITGLLVGTLLIAMYLPIFNLGNALA